MRTSADTQPQDRLQESSKDFGNLPTFTTRLVTSAVYVLVYALAIWFGRYTTCVLMSVVAGFCAYEFYTIQRRVGKIANVPVGVVAAVLFPVGALLFGIAGIALVAVFLLVISLLWYAFFVRVRFVDVAITVAGSLYAGAFLSSFVLLRSIDSGLEGVLLVAAIIASIWANDSFAYIFGSLFGKHKMVPKISPKKSWEGFFAGTLGSMIFWLLIPLIPGIGLAWGWAIAGGIFVGIFSVVGDIIESRLKREAGVKDSGNMLPGHGGFLDRTDSMMLASLAAVLILRLGGVL